MNGFITIDKKILDWEWYRHKNELKLFIHLLLIACYKDCKLRKLKVRRGQVVTTLQKLSLETGLSIQSVRTAIKNLDSTHEITYKPTQEYSIITICKYDTYQSKNNEANTPFNTQTNTPINTQTNTRTNNRINNTNKEKEKRKSAILDLPIPFQKIHDIVMYYTGTPDKDHKITTDVIAYLNKIDWQRGGKKLNAMTFDIAVIEYLKPLNLISK